MGILSAGPAEDGSMAGPSACKMPSSSMTVEKYILQLHQKDDRIRQLEEENKILRSKTTEHIIRIDGLEKELRKFADLVAKLEKELASCRANSAPLKEPPAKKTRRVVHVQPAGHPSPSASSKAQSQQQLATNADDICAKLQNFVEKNSQALHSNGQEMEQSQVGEESIPEQMLKAIAEDPNLFQAILQVATATAAGEEGGTAEADKIDSANFLALFIDPFGATDGQVKGEEQMETETGQQEQQNLDFEEVMQRVIGEAMSGVASPVMAAGGERAAIRTAKPNGTSAQGKGGGRQKAMCHASSAGATPLRGATGKKSGSEVKGGCLAPALLAPGQAHPPLSSSSSSSSSSSAKPFTAEEQKLVNELEARIDENIVRLGFRPLNTSELAVQCTRLMREYSIGQRLFARTVMCKVSQSQGSLSELLSKPRPWHKLTDKGREAFRRIFGWISDDTSIGLLCQLSPRKVTVTEKIFHPEPNSLLEPLDGPDATAMLELSNLGAGKKAPKLVQTSPALVEHSPPKGIKCEKVESVADEPAPAKGRELINVGGRWRHDDIPREKIIAIHEAEKAKLVEQETKALGNLISNSGSRVSSRSPSRASSTLPTEVLLPNKLGQANNSLEELAGPGHSPSSSPRIGHEPAGADPVVPLLFGGQRGAAGGGSKFEPFPIAQSQIECHTSLDTEEIVRQVKQFLAKKAVSQRQFGESILGLSQGSVSDLLARPKAWNLLTPKGREPFVRMQIFLEQYRAQVEDSEVEGQEASITGGGGAERGGGGGLSIEEEKEEEEESEGDVDSGPKLELHTTNSSSRAFGEERSEIDDLTAANEDSEKLLKSILAQITLGKAGKEAERPMKTKSEKTLKRPNGSGPSLLEEIDTADVARRVKESLSKNGISQRAFGEHILKMTSGCVSDLLTKPKPWVMLNWKQRESYQKMMDFLEDPGAVERLRVDEQHRCEMNNALNALKAFAGAANPSSADKSGLAGLAAFVEQQQHSPPPSLLSNGSSPTSTLQIVTNLASELGAHTPIGTILKKANSPNPTVKSGSQQQNGQPALAKRRAASSGTPHSLVGGIEPSEFGLAGVPAKKIPRFQRTLITEKQKEALLFVFAHEQRPNSRCIEQLAAKLGLTPRTVTNWFHNYRTRQKAKEVKQEGEEALPTPISVQQVAQPSNAFIPTPTPAQVLARALNAKDSKSANWFRELADILRRHSDASVDLDSIGTGGGSMGTASAESSPPSPRAAHERAQSCGASSSASVPSPLQHQSSGGAGAGGGGQLDKVIARMHSRLAATGRVQ